MNPINPELEHLIETYKKIDYGCIKDAAITDLATQSFSLGSISALETAIKKVEEFLKSKSDLTFEKTMKGKNSPFEVSDEEWQSTSFSFDDITNVLHQLLQQYGQK